MKAWLAGILRWILDEPKEVIPFMDSAPVITEITPTNELLSDGDMTRDLLEKWAFVNRYRIFDQHEEIHLVKVENARDLENGDSW